jgi:Domain of unknown function (DUF1877)
MSMIGNFRALPEEELQALFANPSRVEQLLYESLLGSASNGNELDVDKAWHGLHFLLTGSAWEGSFPLNFIVAGGEEVGDDLGYGPARGLNSNDVRKIDAALEPLTPEELGQRFDAPRMTELQIYPDGIPTASASTCSSTTPSCAGSSAVRQSADTRFSCT